MRALSRRQGNQKATEVNIFDTHMASVMNDAQQEDSQDELLQYLSTPTETVGDVIQWWMNHRVSYPRLSRMALDYLLIPGKSHRSSMASILRRNCISY